MTDPDELASTMTFRERVAIAAMQGMLSGPLEDIGEEDRSIQGICAAAVKYADKLIIALNAK